MYNTVTFQFPYMHFFLFLEQRYNIIALIKVVDPPTFLNCGAVTNTTKFTIWKIKGFFSTPKKIKIKIKI